MIVDAHSHIGHDWMMYETSVADYISLLERNNIDVGIVMPEPGHISPKSKKRYFLWEFVNDEIKYYSPHYDTSDFEVLTQTSKIINDEIFDALQAYKKTSSTNVKLFFAPMIHPLIDNIEYYSTIKNLYDGCVALKMHGIAGGYSPKMIDSLHTEAIRATGLPLIIHTDYDIDQTSDLGRIRNMNSSRAWLNFLQENKLKGYLCHGCRMDVSVLSDISKTDNILVGLGPDWPIQLEQNRLHVLPNPDYLTQIISMLPKEKLAFDIDYNYMDGDEDFLRRIKRALPEEYYNNVLGENAARFFELNI